MIIKLPILITTPIKFFGALLIGIIIFNLSNMVVNFITSDAIGCIPPGILLDFPQPEICENRFFGISMLLSPVMLAISSFLLSYSVLSKIIKY